MPYYTRNTGKSWTSKDVSQLKQMVRQNTPTRVAGFKLGRTEDAIRAEASKGVSTTLVEASGAFDGISEGSEVVAGIDLVLCSTFLITFLIFR